MFLSQLETELRFFFFFLLSIRNNCFSFRSRLEWVHTWSPRFHWPHFHHVVAERANRSIHQLKCALKEGDVTVGDGALDPSFSASGGDEDAAAAWHELQHSHAGEHERRSRPGDAPRAPQTPSVLPSAARLLFLKHKSANEIPRLNFYL